MPVRAISILVALAAAAVASVASAQGGGVTSGYSRLDRDACTLITNVEETGDNSRRCPGWGGRTLILGSGDGREDVDVDRSNEVWDSLPAFNRIGPRVEWRARGGRPFAIIYRYLLTAPQNRGRTVLAVETLPGGGGGGCLVALVDGEVANANARARRIADAGSPGFYCGRDALRRIGRTGGEVE